MFRNTLLAVVLCGFLGAPALAQGIPPIGPGAGGFPGDFGGGAFPGGGSGTGSSRSDFGGVMGGAGATGAQFRETEATGIQSWQDITPGNITQTPGNTFTTGPQTINAGDFNGPDLPPTMTTQYGWRPGVTLHTSQLPPTRLDSFVKESGYSEEIYGDEGTSGPPPINGFTYQNTIDAGIAGERADGLTTGHQSELPSSWL